MAYSSLGEISDTLEQIFSDAQVDLTTEEIVVATKNLTVAQNIVESELTMRGLSGASLLTWIRGDEFVHDLAVFYTIKDFGRDKDKKRDDYSSWWAVFDRRKELKEDDVVLTDGTLVAGNNAFAEAFNIEDLNVDLGI